MFKRVDATVRVLEAVLRSSPEKIYLIGDGPRDADEALQVAACREAVDAVLDGFTGEVVRNYSETNRGVYENIAGGARWVFGQEERALFLEDDTVPDPSFLGYCDELLERYEDDPRIFMVYGTNYREALPALDGSDYVFTQHMLPCGWASWSDKFLRLYDGELEHYTPDGFEALRPRYRSRRLHAYDRGRVASEYENKLAGGRYNSWDYQLAFSIRHHDVLAIAPARNQITNIGADGDATHGGSSLDDTMTRRFCGVPTQSLPSPLRHPSEVKVDRRFESVTTRIVIPPSSPLRRFGIGAFRAAYRVPDEVSTRAALRQVARAPWRAVRPDAPAAES